MKRNHRVHAAVAAFLLALVNAVGAPSAHAQSFTVITQPVQVPLHWTSEASAKGSKQRKLGIYVALGGSSTPQIFEFDTGGSGFYAASGTGTTSPWWGSASTPTGTTFDQSYDSGTTYVGAVVTTTVQLFESATATTPLLSATDVIVGQATSITDTKDSPPAQLWPLPSDTSTPPVNKAFYGDFGMAPKQGVSGIDSLAAQLQYGEGVTAGFRVHASDENPWVQFGLSASDIAVVAGTYPMNVATGTSPAGVAYYESTVVTGTLSVTDGSRSFEQPTGFIFDTGASTAIHTSTAIPFPSDLTKDGEGSEVKHGAQVVVSATSAEPSAGSQTILSLVAGGTTNEDKVTVQSSNGEYYLNTGILPFLTNDFVFNLAGQQLSIVTPESSDPADLTGDGQVNGSDVDMVLSNFGPCSGCPCDLDDSGTVDYGDVSLVLLSFN